LSQTLSFTFLTMTQDELKALVGQAAADCVKPLIEAGHLIGVGTGSTVNQFIQALAPMASQIRGAVSSSSASTAKLQAMGVKVVDCNEVGELAVYVDGADEINGLGHMIKGGGAALTREKIVAAQSRQFICIVDDSKLVDTLGAFPLPVEVIPMASQRIIRQFQALSTAGQPVEARLRLNADQQALVTDNGQHIIDVRGLQIKDPVAFETTVSQWPGVLTVGVFAHQKASICLAGSAQGVKRIDY
jgi:ribose 5-phosphate isomerase A